MSALRPATEVCGCRLRLTAGIGLEGMEALRQPWSPDRAIRLVLRHALNEFCDLKGTRKIMMLEELPDTLSRGISRRSIAVIPAGARSA
jgi:hypothetical protein